MTRKISRRDLFKALGAAGLLVAIPAEALAPVAPIALPPAAPPAPRAVRIGAHTLTLTSAADPAVELTGDLLEVSMVERAQEISVDSLYFPSRKYTVSRPLETECVMRFYPHDLRHLQALLGSRHCYAAIKLPGGVAAFDCQVVSAELTSSAGSLHELSLVVRVGEEL
jgi:hypothetical protein